MAAPASTPVPAVLIVPDWPVPTHVRAACSTRAGGASVPPYDTLNLGDHVGDDPAAVADNRRRLAGMLQARPVYLRQVHGWQVARLDAASADGLEADACLSTEPGQACTIMVADCLPVLLADTRGRVVGAAHAGWRGLAGDPAGRGVLEALWRDMSAQLAGLRGGGDEVLAWLGPCIGPEAFEVGDEVRAAFAGHDTEAAAHFRAHTPGKWLADLQGLARLRLRRLGITRIHGNDGGADWCTVANASRFFSHRRDRTSGRFAAAVWLAASA